MIESEKELREYCNKAAFFSVGEQPGKKFIIRNDVDYVVRSEVAVEGKVKFIADRDEFFGGGSSRNFTGEVYVDPTWQQVFNEFKKSMFYTRDLHHVFLEGIDRQGKLGDTTIYKFVVGS